MSKDRVSCDDSDDDITVTRVIHPCQNRSASSNLSQSVSKQNTRNNATPYELAQIPRQQRLDFHTSDRALQLNVDEIDFCDQQTKFETLAEDDEYYQESLRQQTYPNYFNESHSNQHPMSAQSNHAHSSNTFFDDQEPYIDNDNELEEDNDQDGPNTYQEHYTQGSNQICLEVSNSQPNCDFQKDYQDHFEPLTSNKSVMLSSHEEVQSDRGLENLYQNHLEVGADQLLSTQHYGNLSFGDMVQRQCFNAQALSALNNNYELENQQKRRFSSTQIYHNPSLQNERSFSRSTPKPNKPGFYRSIELELLVNRIKELQSENGKLSTLLQRKSNYWKKEFKELEEKLHKANRRVEKCEAEAKANLKIANDEKNRFDLCKAQARKDYNAALDDIDHYRNKASEYHEKRDKLQYDLEKQEKNHKLAIHELQHEIEKLKKEANKVTADKSTETDSSSIEPTTKSMLDKSIQTHSELNVKQALEEGNHLRIDEQEEVSMDGQVEINQSMSESAQGQKMPEEIQLPPVQNQSMEEETNSEVLPADNHTLLFREVKTEVIDAEETASTLPSTSRDSTINAECPWLAYGITREEYNESIQAEKSFQEERLSNGDKENKRNGPSQSTRSVQATLSIESGSKRNNSTSTAQNQQRNQKDYYAISKRSRL